MYQANVLGDKLYHATSEGYGDSIELFGQTNEGDTPMSLVVIALGACVTMCIQGFYKRKYAIEVMPITVSTSFENDRFNQTIQLPEKLEEETEQALLAYISRSCNVKKVLRQDLVFNIKFTY
ncbi:OsmC family protein [Streptococcus parauberis]|uniref:OsmC-like protein n=1 Tax=Streptococcus parauberis NCFD 2020 TaxID=873447 RepID=F1YYD8_9STRE|nr:OsmC family protein [Streptococcus parauberis]EGE55001.1 OsmC-like protein [Streptococcus parauberis NCFD 2020]